MPSTIDRLEIARELRVCDLSQAQAEGVVCALRWAHEFDLSALATTSDLALLGSELQGELGTLVLLILRTP